MSDSAKSAAVTMHVVIVGAGFAGVNCAKRLASDSSLRITLIDKNNHQQFQPLLYEVATGILSPEKRRPSFRHFPGQPSEPPSYRHSTRISRNLLCSLLLTLLLAVPLAGQDRRTTTTPSRDQQTTGKTGGGEPTQIITVPQFPVFSDCRSSTPKGSSEARSDLLDKQGPQLTPLFSMSSFAVMGFSRGNWPVAIDYVLEQDSLLLVVISPEGEKPLIYRLEGKKGHWVTKIQIPPAVGDQLRVSQYLVQTLDESVGQVLPSHVHIHGIAAGPKAVGSIGIDQVNFTPGSIRLAQHQKAQFSYHSISDFDDTEVSFVRLAKTNTGEIVAAAIGSKSMGSIAQNHVKNGDWDGSINTGDIVKAFPPELQQWLLAPHGQHVLQVRAWLRKNHGGDFVTALSETIVTVE
jgi:hypothetical protein